MPFIRHPGNQPFSGHFYTNVTIGIKPSRPETGYGYVEAFKEKPDHDIAEKYLKAGNYLWNAGIFVWNIDTITDSIFKYKPNIVADMDKITT